MSSITKKTEAEIKIMAQGGKRLSHVLKRVKGHVRAGMTTEELDKLATRLLHELDAEPSFLNYQPGEFGKPYPSSICVSINDEIVHGIPSAERRFKEGDLVSLDLGAKYKGLYTDMATTFYLGRPTPEIKKLINVTKESLRRAVRVVRPGKPLSEIGKAIESYVKQFNLGIVRDLFGHGVGYKVHEAPRIPNYYDSTLDKVILEPGMCLAIEPMLTLGDYRIKTLSDGWTIVSQDGSLSAHAEVTVAVTGRGNKVLTPFVD